MKSRLLLFFLLLLSVQLTAQDVIVTRSAERIDAKIEEVSKTSIKYKRIDNLSGPTFVLETADIVTIVYADGSVQTFDQVVETKSEKKSMKQYPIVDLSDYHGFLLEEGNCVYVPMDGPHEYERYAQEYLRSSLASDGFWNVVDSINQAHFVLQYGVCLEGQDRGFFYLRTRDSYQSIQFPTYDIWMYKVSEPESVVFTVMAAGESFEQNGEAIDNAMQYSYPTWKENIRSAKWRSSKGAKKIMEFFNKQ